MYWNPDPVAFTIPFLNLPVFYYGIFFVTGFILGYYQMLALLKSSLLNLDDAKTRSLLDKLTWTVVIGTIVGARAGHVLFYDWDYYKDHLWNIINTREGGLSSHGGTVGILLALPIFYYFFFKPTAKKSFLELLDMLVIPTALAATFIRIGNFFNQEILGVESYLPWAITFGNPQDGSPPLPRHPAQLYEALCYLATYLILLYLWNKPSLRNRSGFITGLFFIFVFGSRFLIEFVKEVQHSVLSQNLLQAGQWLSIPFIIIGVLLIVRSLNKVKTHP